MRYAPLILALIVPAVIAVLVFSPRPLSPDIARLFVHEALRVTPNRDTGQTGSAAGETVALPYRCPAGNEPGMEPDRPEDGCPVTFRILHRRDAGEERLWSLYIPSFQGSVSVSLNGVVLASSLWRQPATGAYAAVPMLLSLPDPLLRPGENVFDITLSKRGMPGFLGRAAIGPDTLLRPEYDHRLFLYATLPRMLDGWQIAMGLSLFIMWLARPKERIFLGVSGMLLFHALSSLPGIVGNALDESVLRLAIHGRVVSGSLAVPLAWLFVGRRPPIPVWVFLLIPLAVTVSYAVLSADAHNRVMITLVFPLMLALLLVGLTIVLRVAVVKRDMAATLLSGATLVALLLGIHDALVVHNLLGDNRLLLSRFAGVGIMTTICAVLMWRFAQTMNALDRFSTRLKSEVAAAEEALRRSFAREQAQTRAAVLEGERVRLMSDLHDGIAGQLVSILALCELRDRGLSEAPGAVPGAVRGALADLRLVVASLEDSGDDLGVTLALFRERIEPQLAPLGVTLVWSMAPLPDVPGLHPGATLNIFRILQEAAVNAARHSGSPILAIQAAPSPLPGHGVRLTVLDQGRGGVASRPGSYGLVNMRRRAETLEAELAIDSGPDGTRVTLDLPSRLP